MKQYFFHLWHGEKKEQFPELQRYVLNTPLRIKAEDPDKENNFAQGRIRCSF